MFDIDVDNKPKSMADVARSHQKWLLVTILVLAVSAGFAAYYVLRQIEYQMERSATAASDNRTWVFSQLEVDLLKFTSALASLQIEDPDAGSLETVRTQFDILFSRVSLIRTSDRFSETALAAHPDWQRLAGGDGLLDGAVPLIDGSDAALVAAVPLLYAEYVALQPGIRRAVVDTLLDIMADGDETRNKLRDTLRIAAIATLWLFFGVLTLMTGLYMQGRARMRHANILERAVDNLRNTINSALDAVLILDSTGRIIGSNRATERMFGGIFVPGEHHLEDYLRDSAAPDSRIDLASVPRGQRSRLQCRRIDGREFPAEASLATGSASSGEPITVVFLRDISEQLAYEESLAKARNAALEADEAKARFLAVMSHEMRTPLNGLLSAVDLLNRTTSLDDEQKWLADIIRTCGQTTLEQVNNVLQLTRLASEEAGEYPVIAFSLVSVVQDMTREFCADAVRSGNSLRVEAPEGAPGIELPLQLLRRALANLLSNAVKFTEKGAITVRIAWTPAETSGNLRISVSVEDTGIGIEASDLERVFRNFETLDSSYVRVREGSGLGLGIAKLSVEAMGGWIEAESTPGRGSRFTIHVEAPVAELQPTEDSPSSSDAAPLTAVHVLVAEDNAINRALLTRQLEGLGAIVTAVVDGRAAVDAARAGRFDVILMDISMPRMDGLMATGLIRAESACSDVPVIAITAQASPDRMEQYAAAGMSEVLIKPAGVAQLVSAIRRHVASAQASPQAEGPAASARPRQKLGDGDHIQSLIEDFGAGYLAKMLSSFEQELGKTLADVDDAIGREDLQNAGKHAHSSAGAAAALGLVALHKALITLETAALSQDKAQATALLHEAHALAPASIAHLRAMLAGTGAITTRADTPA
jgi:hypothetical protein